MEPPAKRMRLSMFADQPSDGELDTARIQNDTLLKNRFEAIFEKYSRDFSDIGDEIDLMTGEIVVDNGHLARMDGETDVGAVSSNSGPDGKALLRAMTHAPDTDDPYFNEGADDVIMSIETIAEIAGLEDVEGHSTPEDSEDDLFDIMESSASASRSTQSTSSTSQEPVQGQYTNSDVLSDVDSLFGDQFNMREDSPDSLFDVEIQPQQTQLDQSSLSDLRQSAIEDPTDKNAIIARFGESVGQEVIQLLSNNAQAHIEPAWRIPVNVAPRPVSRSSVHSKTPMLPIPTVTRSEEINSPAKGRSLWKMPHSHPKSSPKRLRAESEDPLQKDFSDNRDETPYYDANADSSDDDDEYKSSEDEEDSMDFREQLISQAICPFCRKRFKHRGSTVAHLAHYVRRSNKGETADSIHDVNYIRTRRNYAKKSNRGPRLLVCDFKTVVELHEGAGLSFAEIAQSEVMRTGKSGPRLSDLYDKHRTPPDCETVGERRKWTKDEDDLLKELAADDLTTMATLRRRIKKRNELEIGDRLANMWLDQLKKGTVPQSKSASIPQESVNVRNATTLPQTLMPNPQHFHEEHLSRTAARYPNKFSESGQYLVKAELSDDDLFGT